MHLHPLPGFNPMQVSWGGPNEPVTEDCSYCDAPLPEDSIPLIIWSEDGWTARFCDGCQERWLGIRHVDTDPEPEEE